MIDKRIPELDGVRFFAISLVVMAHYFNPLTFSGKRLLQPLLNIGWSGVDLFFVLSGFLVATIVLKHRRDAGFGRVFYARRVLRILPLYYLFLGAGYFLAQAIAPETPVPWWAFALHLQPIWMAWTGTQTHYFLNIAWSLGLEEYFYLTLPLLVGWLSPRQLWKLGWAALLVLPLLRVGFAAQGDAYHIGATLLRPDGLVMGVMIALALVDSERTQWLQQHSAWVRSVWWGLLAGCVTMQFFDVKFYYAHFNLILVGVYPWLAAFYAVSVLRVLTGNLPTYCRTFLRWAPVTWVGRVSYCLYLFHMIFYTALREFTGRHTVGIAVAALGLCGLWAAATWRWLEGPLIGLGRRLQYGRSWASYAERFKLSAGDSAMTQ